MGKKNLKWLKKHQNSNVLIKDISDSIGLLAVQGPKSRKILNQVEISLKLLPSMTFRSCPQLTRFTYITGQFFGCVRERCQGSYCYRCRGRDW